MTRKDISLAVFSSPLQGAGVRTVKLATRLLTKAIAMRPVLALLAAATLLLAACGSKEPPPAQTPAAASTRTPPPKVQGGAYRIYITNEMSGDLTVLEGLDHSIVTTLPLGKRPRGVHVSPDGKTLYVALSGSPLAPPGVDESTLPPPDKAADGIGVIDTQTLKITRVLRGYSDPEQMDVSADGSRLYLASEDTGMAIVADGQSGEVKVSLPVGGEPEGVALTPDGRQVYVSSEEDSKISVIDTATDKVVASIPVGKRPRDIAFTADGNTAYVTGESDASLTIIDVKSSRAVATMTLAGESVRPMGVVVAPDAKRVFVATGRAGKVLAIDTATRTVVGSVAAGQRPWGLAISPDGKFLYAANGPSNDVSVIDAEKLEPLATIPAGNRPWGIAVGKWPAQ
jgi:YVTN family beta-propeller protein